MFITLYDEKDGRVYQVKEAVVSLAVSPHSGGGNDVVLYTPDDYSRVPLRLFIRAHDFTTTWPQKHVVEILAEK